MMHDFTCRIKQYNPLIRDLNVCDKTVLGEENACDKSFYTKSQTNRMLIYNKTQKQKQHMFSVQYVYFCKQMLLLFSINTYFCIPI